MALDEEERQPPTPEKLQSPEEQQCFQGQEETQSPAPIIEQVHTDHEPALAQTDTPLEPSAQLPLSSTIDSSVDPKAVAVADISIPDAKEAAPIITSGPGNINPNAGRQRIRPRKLRTLALITLILLFVISSVWSVLVRPRLPAANASVTITPASENFSNNYTISAVTGTPDASQYQVGARLVSSTTSSKSITVKATGKGHQDATQAQGYVYLKPSSGGYFTNGVLHITSNSGVAVTISVGNGNLTTGGINLAGSYSASADKPGPAGNLPANDINGTYYDELGHPYYAQNTAAFTGGQDAYDYTSVQESDIGDAASGLESQLTSESAVAQTAAQQQVRANEQIASDIQCNPNISSNHQVNDRATNVTITVSITCQSVAYEPQVVRSMAADLLKRDARDAPFGLGANYSLAGQVVTTPPQVVTTTTLVQPGTREAATLEVHAQGVWIFEFSQAQKQKLAALIAGKTQADATALLLKQEGIREASIQTSGGWGSAFPTSPGDIKMEVLGVPGL